MIEISELTNDSAYKELEKNYIGQKRERDTESEIASRGTDRIVRQGTKEHYVLKRVHVWAHEKCKTDKCWVPEDEISPAIDFDAKATINTLKNEHFLDRKGVSGSFEYRLTTRGLNSITRLENNIRSKNKGSEWKDVQEAEQKACEDAFAEKEMEAPATVAIEPETVSEPIVEESKAISVETETVEPAVNAVAPESETTIAPEVEPVKTTEVQNPVNKMSEHPLYDECNKLMNELDKKDVDVVQIIYDTLLAKKAEIRESERENTEKMIEAILAKRDADKKAEDDELKQMLAERERKRQEDDAKLMKQIEELKSGL